MTADRRTTVGLGFTTFVAIMALTFVIIIGQIETPRGRLHSVDSGAVCQTQFGHSAQVYSISGLYPNCEVGGRIESSDLARYCIDTWGPGAREVTPAPGLFQCREQAKVAKHPQPPDD